MENGLRSGYVYFASSDAYRKRYYSEGQRVTLEVIAYVTETKIAEDFWRLELDSTGTCYIDVKLEAVAS